MSSKHFNFVRAENIKNFQRRLQTESDPEKREMLNRLLAEEVAGRLSPEETGAGAGPDTEDEG